MPSVRACFSGGTLTPFLYPAFAESTLLAVSRTCPLRRRFQLQARCNSTATEQPDISRLDPTPDDYSLTPFADRAILTLEAGAGGHGCVSFLREMFTPEGPANGGDGGSGGNIYIQAVRGETSLHKLARRRLIRAGRGRNGQGKVKGGERGADVLIKVPVGTIVREIQRHDPVEILLEEAEKAERERERAEANGDVVEEDGGYKKDRWLVYPGTVPTELNRMKFPQLPKPRRSHLAALEPQSPIWLDLDKHMETPVLLAAGAMGGLGNPNFMTPFNNRPKMATRGEEGLKISVQLELKILADLGLVGLPNAGKSTLLRALSNSRARVGNWAFTTLQPNVGTVVLDNHKGRPLVMKRNKHGELRESFTIADVPGLIEDAHLDKGLGLGFLRHIERAAVLAFVIDLNAGDAVAALKLLWREVSEYESQRGKELNAETERRMVTWMPANRSVEPKSDSTDEFDIPDLNPNVEPLPFIASEPISAKPWFVVATKADLDGTQENYEKLHRYLQDVKSGAQPHPSGKENSWKRDVSSIPISAINAHGVQAIPQIVMDLLDD